MASIGRQLISRVPTIDRACIEPNQDREQSTPMNGFTKFQEGEVEGTAAEKRCQTMRHDSWVAATRDGRSVKYAYKELSDGIAGVSAEAGGRFLIILQKSIRTPLTRKQVEAFFEPDDLELTQSSRR
jgi:hypothetical protein